MTGTMLAARFHADTKMVVLEDIPIPEPGPGEVLVQIAYCGICHSDLSLINGTFPAQLPVITQGHEAAGTITKLGSGVTGWSIGDRVILPAGRACHECRFCRAGNPAKCERLQLMSFAYDGAWAQYALVRASGLTRVPDNVPLEQAAILADAVSTPFGAVVHSGRVRVGESVGVWGLGGVGTHVMQIARVVGAAPILAFDINPAALERATDLGADYAFDTRDPELWAKVKDATDGAMLDVAFDAVGRKSTFDQAHLFTRTSGRTIVVGMSTDNASLGPTAGLVLSRKTIQGHLGYNNEDIGTLAKLVSHGRIDLSRSVSTIIPLTDIHEGIRMLETGESNPIRILVKPN